MGTYPRFFVALGGGDEVGASSYLLQVGDRRVLIDAGLRLRGDQVYPDFAYVSQVDMLGLWQCDCVCLTHAHLDHSGALPAVHEKAPETPLYATPPTKAIASILLRDTIKIAHKRGHFLGDVLLKEYTEAAMQRALDSLIECPFAEPIEAATGIQVTFYPAGHILGAAMILVEIGEFRALFTGDFSGDGQLTVSGYQLPDTLPPLDLMVCESTYAYKGHESDDPLPQQQLHLMEQVVEAISRGGKVLIPSFAVGRAQEILSLLHQGLAGRWSERFPVWSDGMVNQVCQVYNRFRAYLSPTLRSAEGDAFFDPVLGIQRAPFKPGGPDFVASLDSQPPCCIVASSGMLVSGSRSASYAAKLLEGKRNRILFTGYLDEESPGRGLLKAISRKPRFRLSGKDYTIRAEVQHYHLSAHPSLNQIVELVQRVQPAVVIFVHGQPGHTARDNLYSRLHPLTRQGIHPHVVRTKQRIDL